MRGGPAAQNGGLHSGDELVSLNGVTFDNVPLDMAVQALKLAPKGKQLVIYLLSSKFWIFPQRFLSKIYRYSTHPLIRMPLNSNFSSLELGLIKS